MLKSDKVYKAVFNWQLLPEDTRPTKQAVMQIHGIRPNDFEACLKEIKEELAKEDTKAYLKSQAPRAARALMEACDNHNAQALKIYYQLTDELTEKSETKVKLSLDADEIARQHTENRRWLREHGFLEEPGVGQVQSESALLPKDIREDTGQTEGDNPSR